MPSVSVGGAPCGGVEVANSSVIRCTLPPSLEVNQCGAGMAPVSVWVMGLQSALHQFTYVDPTPLTVKPVRGPCGAGRLLIRGPDLGVASPLARPNVRTAAFRPVTAQARRTAATS